MSWFGIDDPDKGDEQMTIGYITEQQGQPNLGNSDAANFPKDESAMDLVNSPQVKSDFNLGSAPIPPPRTGRGRAIPKFNRTVGDINWKTGETWGVFIGGVSLGIIALTVWNNMTR